MHPLSERKGRTLLHEAPAWLKLAFALLIAISTTLLPSRPGALYLLPGLTIAVLWFWARLPLGLGLRKLLVAEFFILGVASLSLLSPRGGAVFLGMLLKSNLCVSALILLNWTTAFSELILVLRRLRLPDVMLTTLTLMYRYLPVLSEESRRMQRARASRTFSTGKRLAWLSSSTVLAQLFLRSLDRAERIYLAMCARGWK